MHFLLNQHFGAACVRVLVIWFGVMKVLGTGFVRRSTVLPDIPEVRVRTKFRDTTGNEEALKGTREQRNKYHNSSLPRPLSRLAFPTQSNPYLA